jgi:dihydrodipicolinate synthase/N-acetylneuraminate lyase
MPDVISTPTRRRLQGVVAAMVTPMRDGWTCVDLEATARLTTWLVERGLHGLFIAGTTGEGLYLSRAEHRDLTRAVVQAPRGIPVVPPVGAHTTAQAAILARHAAQARIVAMQNALGDGARLGWYKDVPKERGVPVGGVRAPMQDPSPPETDVFTRRLKEMNLLQESPHQVS